MTTTLSLGDTVSIEGAYGVLEKVRGEDVYVACQELPGDGRVVRRPAKVVPPVDKNSAKEVKDKELVIVDGCFYRVSFQGARFAEVLFLDRALEHIDLNRSTRTS